MPNGDEITGKNVLLMNDDQTIVSTARNGQISKESIYDLSKKEYLHQYEEGSIKKLVFNEDQTLLFMVQDRKVDVMNF